MAVPLAISLLPPAWGNTYAGHSCAHAFCYFLPVFAGKAKGWSDPGAQLSGTPLKEQVRQDGAELRAAAASRLPSAASLSFQLRNRFKKKVPRGSEAAHVAVGEVEFLEKPFTAFIRLRRGVVLGSLAEVALPSR